MRYDDDRKTVYLNDVSVGSAGTWQDAAALIGRILRRHVTMREIFKRGSEGHDGFYVWMPVDD